MQIPTLILENIHQLINANVLKTLIILHKSREQFL